MSAIDQLFSELKQQGRKALMPFVTAGDPDVEFTAALIRELAARGATMCEIGIPYSDPIADGPVIQASYTRALDNHVKLADIVAMLGEVTSGVTMPIVTMISYAIIHRHGLERYVTRAKAAGVAGAIVPDLLVEEAGPFSEICRREDFSLIQLVTPTTPRDRALRIAESSTGFLYYVSVTGITGERQTLPAEVTENVGWLRAQTDLPICIGFGISQPDHVRVLSPVADGLIVGSAFVRRIATAADRSRADVLREIGDFASSLLETLND
ncbi:MAG TPA: tryptophan synthase subunit alpha [Pirellulaceae bacterium]|jgi:tryptophan synthase alpha chain|nr:tryptophan synthase subunit alpha [Pirellulaceae bacterium]